MTVAVGEHPLVTPVLAWFDEAARDLPWRRPGTDPYAVLVSEVMLQQTPVARVLPAWTAWLARWPDPPSLAAASTAEVLRAWDRLGYPRRALRLQQAARACVERHDGAVPDDLTDLLALPGVGAYTARAVLSFAYGRREPVVDTNVRRVLARAVVGRADAWPPSVPRDLEAGRAVLPEQPARAARWAAASMELGAVVCTARSPHCDACPVVGLCAWSLAGRPAAVAGAGAGAPRRSQAWAGTDRQARGRLMAVLRATDGPVHADELAAAWSDDPVQRGRALAGLIADGLAVPAGDGWSLPA